MDVWQATFKGMYKAISILSGVAAYASAGVWGLLSVLSGCNRCGRLAAEWAELVRGLDNLQQVELFVKGIRFLLRSQLKCDASQAVRAAEVALLPALREIA